VVGTGTAEPDGVALVELVEEGADVPEVPQAAATTPTRMAAMAAADPRYRRGLGKEIMLPVRLGNDWAGGVESTWVPAVCLYPIRPTVNRPTPYNRSNQPVPIRGWADR
jgi:hypothetical protein